MSNYDLIIIGSGPAGTATAISCAQKGLSSVIIERVKSSNPRPGETLPPGIEPLLNQLGVGKLFLNSGFLRHKGNWVQWDDKLQFDSFGKYDNANESWEGFQVSRPQFDNILLNYAQNLSVDVINSCSANKPISDKNKIIGIETSKGFLHSSFVVDAAGSQHWLARKLGLKIQNYSPPLLVHYGYVEGNCPFRNDAPYIVADKHGWVWTARIKPNLYQWTRLFFSKQHIDRKWAPTEFQELKQKGITMGSDVTWRIVSEPSGLGYFITGDAAAVLDPASSHGILKAIMSGMMTAHMISKINNDSSVEELAIAEYSRWIKEWFLHDVKKLKELYRKHPNPPEWVLENSTMPITN